MIQSNELAEEYINKILDNEIEKTEEYKEIEQAVDKYYMNLEKVMTPEQYKLFLEFERKLELLIKSKLIYAFEEGLKYKTRKE